MSINHAPFYTCFYTQSEVLIIQKPRPLLGFQPRAWPFFTLATPLLDKFVLNRRMGILSASSQWLKMAWATQPVLVVATVMGCLGKQTDFDYGGHLIELLLLRSFVRAHWPWD